jgi:hypothetical protein
VKSLGLVLEVAVALFVATTVQAECAWVLWVNTVTTAEKLLPGRGLGAKHGHVVSARVWHERNLLHYHRHWRPCTAATARPRSRRRECGPERMARMGRVSPDVVVLNPTPSTRVDRRAPSEGRPHLRGGRRRRDGFRHQR